jgi:hypothetical protein
MQWPKGKNDKQCSKKHFQIFCTIRMTGHRIEPGTAVQCKTKDSS